MTLEQLRTIASDFIADNCNEDAFINCVETFLQDASSAEIEQLAKTLIERN